LLIILAISRDECYQKRLRVLIFQPFERVNNNDVKGLGVGLFIAKQIAKAHGGDVKVSSSSGHGAEFLMQLPVENVRN